MNSLIASIVWDEARFGLPLDLERFMIVAVGDFNMGAMENKGLNIFNTKYVLANAGHRDRRRLRDIEIAWSATSTSTTGPATASPAATGSSCQPEGRPDGLPRPGVQHGHGGQRRRRAPSSASRTCACCAQVQFPEDAGPMAHPVRPDSYVEINNFYTATVYEKGAEVVRMMQTLVGRDGFARGMTLYFERHDGQAVTCDDFAQAIADANPDSALARTAAAVQALVRAGRHAARDGARPLRRAVAHLHARPRADAARHAGAGRQAAVRDPGRDGPARRATAARCRCSSRTSRRAGAHRARAGARRGAQLLHLRRRRQPSRCPRCCAASRRR